MANGNSLNKFKLVVNCWHIADHFEVGIYPLTPQKTQKHTIVLLNKYIDFIKYTTQSTSTAVSNSAQTNIIDDSITLNNSFYFVTHL